MQSSLIILATLTFLAFIALGLTRYALPSLLTAAMVYLLAVLVMA